MTDSENDQEMRLRRSEAVTFSGDQIASMDLPDWESIHEYLQSRFLTGDFATGLEFVNRVGAAAEEANHHPDIDLRYPHVNIKMMSHDVFAKTERDVALARKISAIAKDMGIKSAPDTSARLEIGLDTWDVDEIKPFWMAVLGLQEHPRFDTDLRDNDADLATLWFQKCEPHQEPTQRFHLDIRVPPAVGKQRILDAVAAGGTIVSTEHEPRFTVLADPQGNKVCVCTYDGRDD